MNPTPPTLDVPIDVVLPLAADIGEGPYWDAPSRTLVLVDSTPGRVHRYDPATGRVASREVGQPVGAAIPRRGGGLVATGRDGLLAVDETGGGVDLLVPVERDNADNRMNDAKCDARGRLFVGTFSTTFARKAGALYRIDPDLAVTRVAEGLYISNGIAWSPDDRRMYFVDSATRGVDVFDYDIESGRATKRRRFCTIDRPPLPDGLAVDAEGHLWVALYRGGAVRRYDPDGRWVATLELPVARVTSCAFGGTDLRDLYVTSATHLARDDGQPQEPDSGALFRCRPGVAGWPVHPFGG